MGAMHLPRFFHKIALRPRITASLLAVKPLKYHHPYRFSTSSILMSLPLFKELVAPNGIKINQPLGIPFLWSI
jgi:hypothetical protein